ncbi:MAG: hypothetical protein HY738_20240 [Bacteroidia bacterium]|nr:hypothetical protein [Bacteroidia bacterium]
MSYTLVALAPKDGWAYVKKDDNLYLIYPPFDNPYFNVATEEEFIKAIDFFGFESRNKEFVNINELIRFIKEEYNKHIDPEVLKITNDELLDELLSSASEEDIEYYLEIIKNEFLPNNKIDAAKKLLNKLYNLSIVENDSYLRNKIKKMYFSISYPLNIFYSLEIHNSAFQKNFLSYKAEKATNICVEQL